MELSYTEKYPHIPYYYITNNSDLHLAIEDWITDTSIRKVGIDTEGTGLDCHTAKLRLIQLYTINKPGLVIDCFACSNYVPLIQKLIDSKRNCVFIGHTLNYELKMAWSHGIELYGSKLYDTFLAASVLDCGLGNPLGLKDVSQRVLNVEVDKTEQKSDWGKDKLDKQQLDYGILDSKLVVDLEPKLTEELFDEDLVDCFQLERKVLPALAAMEWYGLEVDLAKWEELRPFYEARVSKAEEAILDYVDERYELHDLFGNVLDSGFSVTSSSQVLTLLHDLGIPNPLKEEKGYEHFDLIPSTGKNVTALLDWNDYPVLEALDNHRKASKLLSGFIYNLPEFINPTTKRVHTHFRQMVSTGRMCLARGTKVTLVGEYKNIEDVQVGDLVYCYSDTGELKIRKVLNVWNKGVKKTVKVKWQSSKLTGEVICTADHRFKTKYRGWVEAKELSNLDFIYSDLSEDITVEEVSNYSEIEVWDLEIEEYNNFIANHLCVHNSSSSPNLNQLPRPQKGVPNIREMYIPREGYTLNIFDYCQIELRVIADVCVAASNDKSQTFPMLQEFLDGKDPYASTACVVNNLSYDTMLNWKRTGDPRFKEYRQKAKPVRLGYNYALGAAKFRLYAKQQYRQSFTREECFETRKRHFDHYWELKDYHAQFNDKTIVEVRTFDKYRRKRKFKVYPGVPALSNFPIQGGAGNIQKEAIYTLFDHWFKQGYSPLQSHDKQLLLTVHDELNSQLKLDKAEESTAEIKHFMMEAGRNNLEFCPIDVEGKLARTLADKD